MKRFLAALRRFWYPFSVQAEMGRFLACAGSRGEIADAPEPYPPRLPRTKTCPLNAQPHWCCDPAESDDEVIAAMEKQFRKPTFRRIR